MFVLCPQSFPAPRSGSVCPPSRTSRSLLHAHAVHLAYLREHCCKETPVMRTSPLKSILCSLSLLLIGTAPVINVHAAGSFTEYTDKASFISALTNPTIIDFESLAASSTVVGN